MALLPPEPLSEMHQVGAFSCGVPQLDEWLKRRALINQASGASRTFVVADGNAIVAYYALAAGAVSVAAPPGRFRRNMPDPIPVAVLGRLAVDERRRGQGIGRALVRDCAMRVAHAADSIGIRGVLVHAVSEEARTFYLAVGFDTSPIEPMTLMVTLADIRKGLE